MFLLLAFLCVGQVESIGQHGIFETPNGSSCTWFHLRTNVTEQSLGIACWCRTISGSKQDYGCSFSTPTDKCNKDSDNFFEKMVKLLEGMLGNQINCPYHTA